MKILYMSEILWMRRIHSIHEPHATDVYNHNLWLYKYRLTCSLKLLSVHISFKLSGSSLSHITGVCIKGNLFRDHTLCIVCQFKMFRILSDMLQTRNLA